MRKNVRKFIASQVENVGKSLKIYTKDIDNGKC